VPQWHFKSNDDLRTFFNSHFPLPNQVSWNVFQLHSGVAMRVISLLRIKHSSLDEWRDYQKSDHSLESLDPICHAYGTGPLSTGHTICMEGQSPHRIRSTSTTRSVRRRTHNTISNSLWLCHGHWPNNRFGQRNQPGKIIRER
jgi:hypothetical protein